MIATPVWEHCTANPVAFIPCSNSLSFCASTKLKMPQGKILFEDRCWSQNSRHGVHKENICRVRPARFHKSGWDLYSPSSGAQNAYKMHATVLFWGFCAAACLHHIVFPETEMAIAFKSKSQVMWWFITTRISWLNQESSLQHTDGEQRSDGLVAWNLTIIWCFVKLIRF